MPTSADLVTDLPADFAAFGQPVDTSLKALNPETTLGDIAYRSSTSNTNTRLGIGSTGQVLTVAAGVPSWATPASGGGMTLLQTLSLAGVATVTSASIANTYKNLLFVIKGVYFSTTTNADLGMRFNSDTGNNYTYRGFFQQAGTAQGDEQTNGAQLALMTANNLTGSASGNAIVDVMRYTDTSGVLASLQTYGNTGGTTYRAANRLAYYNGASAISTVTFFYIQGGGNWADGTIYVYGVS